MFFEGKPLSAAIKDIVDGKRSCIDIVTESLRRIEMRDKDIRAFCSVQGEMALERARMLDALDADKKASMKLLGIPVAIKDNICTRDIPTTCSSRMLEHFKPPYDAAVIEGLRKEGAVLIGKTNLDEFAMGSSTETSACGPTRNPHDLSRVPGGSSGGSAAAVAAEMVPAALGSDTGGSIRQPCSFCGVAGLKPTYGRVSRYGLVAFASSLDQIGPVADDVRDLGLLLSVLSTPDERDATCARKPFAETDDLYRGAIEGMRIGKPREYFGVGLSQDVREAVEAAMAALAERGAVFVDVSLPNVKNAIAAYYIICTAEASSNLARFDGVKYGHRSRRRSDLTEMYQATREEGFGAEVKRRIMLGTYVLSSGYYDAYYLKAAKVRTLITADFDRAFTQCDALVSPVVPSPAFGIGEKSDDPLQMYLSDIYTVSANLAGIPGLSVPCGDQSGLPIGLQLMSPQWREDVLLKLGFAVQCWHRQKAAGK